jgi:hypothetical protein
MKAISDLYTSIVHDNLRPLYANWEPGTPIKLGDFGFLDNYRFTQMGNVAAMGIKTTSREDVTTDHKYFASEGSTDIAFHAKGSVAPTGGTYVNATLEVGFTSREAMFFNAAECLHNMIEDKDSLGKSVLELYDNDKWDDGWVVVTDLISAKSVAIAISASSSASISFEASGDVPSIKLADASIGLSIKSATNVGFQLAGQTGGVLLIGLCGISSRFLGFGRKWTPTNLNYGLSTLRRAGPDATQIKVQFKKQRIDFMQLH